MTVAVAVALPVQLWCVFINLVTVSHSLALLCFLAASPAWPPVCLSCRYVQQGLRAVNQAMGRVIRHRWDYGAVLLADERFGSQQNLRNMSKWLRDQLVQHNSFGGAIASLTRFFKVTRGGGGWECVYRRAAGWVVKMTALTDARCCRVDW